MSKYDKYQESPFFLEGKFQEFVIKDGYKIKGLILDTAEGECYVKLAKNLRHAFDWRLPKGTLLQIVGKKQHCIESGKVKLKAERVIAVPNESHSPVPTPHSPLPTPTPNPPLPTPNSPLPTKRSTVLVCQKSDCMKKGGKAVCQALEAALSEKGLEDSVTIKGTGCMKNCKAGANLVMPDKTRYSRVTAAQVPELVEKHLVQKAASNKKQDSEVAMPMAGLVEATCGIISI
jgi:(2Fe-2S) ferredoxin